MSSTRALLARSLAFQTRTFAAPGGRLATAVLCMLVLFSMKSGWEYGYITGAHLLQAVVMALACIGTLSCITLFSTAVTDEKEEGNLGLLRMAGLGPSGLLIGIGLARWWEILLMIGVTLPPTMLAVTLGGVTATQIIAVFLALIAYFGMIAGLGLLASTIAANGARAGSFVIIALIGLYVVPAFTVGIGGSMIPGVRSGNPPEWYAALAWWIEQSAWVRFNSIMSSTTSGLFAPQLLIDLGIGLASVLLAWRLFPKCAHDTHDTDGLKVRVQRRWRSLSSAPTGISAIGWKDFHTVCGGWIFMVIKGLVVVAGAAGIAMIMEGANTAWRNTGTAWCFIGLGWIVAESGLIASRLFANEVREQTVGTILSLPYATSAICYAKIRWALLALTPACALTAGGVLAIVWDMGITDAIGWFWRHVVSEGGWWYFVAIALTFVHLSAWLSITMKRSAVAAAGIICFLIWIVTVICLELGGFRFTDTTLVVAALPLVGYTVLMHLHFARHWASAATRG